MTHNDDAFRLLAEYAAGNLTEAERNQLAKEALADSAVFEALVEEEASREALEDPIFRRRVKERLRELGAERDPFWTRLFQYLLTPKGMLTVGGALATVTVAVLVQYGVLRPGGSLIQVNLGPTNGPAAATANIAAEPSSTESNLRKASSTRPPESDPKAVLQLDRKGRRPVYSIGDRQRIGFQIETPGNVLLWEEHADGTTYRLFPNRYQSSPLVQGGKTWLVPPSGQGDLQVQGPTGQRVLRLLIFPADRNPLELSSQWDELRRDAKEVRVAYEVKEKQ
jgi:hypothetical protein